MISHCVSNGDAMVLHLAIIMYVLALYNKKIQTDVQMEF